MQVRYFLLLCAGAVCLITSLPMLCMSIEKHFFRAIRKGDAITVQSIIEQFKDEREKVFFVNKQGVDNWLPLQWAAAYGYVAIVKALIQAGAEVNKSDEAYHVTPLHVAALNGRKDVAALLLEEGADIDKQDIDGDTPLKFASYYAYRCRDVTILRMFVDVHESINKVFKACDLNM
jgi:ankyrin repeat protein